MESLLAKKTIGCNSVLVAVTLAVLAFVPVSPKLLSAEPPLSIYPTTTYSTDELSTEPTFTLYGVRAVGASPLNALYQKTLDRMMAPMLGKPITLKQLQNAALAYQRVLAQENNVLVSVVLPPQSLSKTQAVVNFQVIQGHLSDVRGRNEGHPYSAVLDRYIKRINLKSTKTIVDLERVIGLANALPGVAVQGHWAPASDEAGAVFFLKQAYKPVDLLSSASSQMSSWKGSLLIQHDLSKNGIFSADRFSLTTVYAQPKSRTFYHHSAEYSIFVGDNGTRLRSKYGVTHIAPLGSLEYFHIQAKTQSGLLEWQYPLLKNLRQTLLLGISLGYYLSSSDRIIITPFQQYKMNVFRDEFMPLTVSLSYQHVGARAKSVHEFSMIHGMSSPAARAGARYAHSRPKARLSFTKWVLRGDYDYACRPHIQSFSSLHMQWAPYTLAASQQISYGGAGMGGAYNASTWVGDAGFLARQEIRYLLSRHLLQRGSSALVSMFHRTDLSVYTGADMALVWNADSQNFYSKAAAASGFVGIRGMHSHYVLQSECAFPIRYSYAIQEKQSSRFRVLMNFLVRF